MKRVTVKDKIVLLLSQYTNLDQEYELSVDLTQDGIARGVGITRSHVAINMTTLKSKGLVEEHMGRVKGHSRQRKIYFLTDKGKTYSNELKGTLHIRPIMIKNMEGEVIEIKMSKLALYLFPFVNRYFNIYELIRYIPSDSVFDTKSFVEQFKADESARTEGKAAIPEVPKAPSPQPAPTPMAPSPTTSEASEKATAEPQQPVGAVYNQMYYNPNVPFQPPPGYPPGYGYQSYYPPPARGPYGYGVPPHPYYQLPPQYRYVQLTPEMLKRQYIGNMSALFALSIFFNTIGMLSMVMTAGYCSPGFFGLFFFSMILALLGFSTGFSKLAFIGKKGKRIMLGMGIYYVFSLIVLLETLFFNFITYLEFEEVYPIFLAMFSFLGLIILGKPLKTELRIELAVVVGVFSILFGIFSGLLLPAQYIINPFVLSPFWILFGATAVITGNELYPNPEEKEKKFQKYLQYIVTGIGAFLTVLLLTRLLYIEYDSSLIPINYVSDACWLGIGLYLVTYRFLPKSYTERMFESIKLTLPLGMGFLFILFGVFLATWGKLFEGSIEIIIGAVIIRYGLFKKLKSKDQSELLVKLSFPIFLLVSEGITFYLILFS
jgi:DNA-binding MarR family transcriptional regulator